MLYLFSPKKAFKAVKKAVATTATGGLNLAAEQAQKAITPKIPEVSQDQGNQIAQDAQEQVKETEEAATSEASRRSVASGSGFQQTLLSGFSGGASGDQLRKKTLLGG